MCGADRFVIGGAGALAFGCGGVVQELDRSVFYFFWICSLEFSFLPGEGTDDGLYFLQILLAGAGDRFTSRPLSQKRSMRI